MVEKVELTLWVSFYGDMDVKVSITLCERV